MRSRTIEQVDEGTYLASVSDLMSGLIFIFIILLLVFAIGLREQEDRKQEEIKKLTGAAQERAALLRRLKDDLRRAGIEVMVDEQQGVLRLGEAILFPLGKAELQGGGEVTIQKLARVLADVLPCYTARRSAPVAESCNGLGRDGRVDALFIEGHTDDLKISGGAAGFKDNWDLSTARARMIYLNLIESSAELREMKNDSEQEVISLSGYGESRPVVPNTSDEQRQKNRRIDLRFLMVPPRDALPDPAERVRDGMSR